jgi:hypothetical protein
VKLLSVGEVCTVFKWKNTAQEAAERKKRKQIENRIRPTEKQYYIATLKPLRAGSLIMFFTTGFRGAGHYWPARTLSRNLMARTLPGETDKVVK